MKLKQKSWLWDLTIFAGRSCSTTIGETIYLARGVTIYNMSIIEHEKIHIEQQSVVGLIKFVFLYLFCCPFFYNPWRWKWEMEAYTTGSRWNGADAEKILGSFAYGWLKKAWH